MPKNIKLTILFALNLGLMGCVNLVKYDRPMPELNLNSAAVTQISPELLVEELEFIKQQLLLIHPKPFARLSQQEFEQQFQSIKQSLNYPLSRSEFYLKAAPLLASLADVHSYLNLPKDSLGDFKFRGEKLFPLAVILENEVASLETKQLTANGQLAFKVYVAADLSEHPSIKSGAQILSINHAPVEFLVNSMRSLTAKETSSGQRRKVQMNFAWLLSAMGYGGENYHIEYLWQGSRYQTTLVGLIPPQEKAAVSAVSYYGFSTVNTQTSLLWLNDFNEKPEVFRDYLTLRFEQMAMAETENLIIDLRFNSGGLSQNLAQLLAFISPEEIFWASKGQIKASKAFKKKHFARTRQRRIAKYNWSLNWLPLEWTDPLQQAIVWADEGEMLSFEIDKISPADNYKPKRIWVLTNGFCYSSCSYFVASVNHFKLANTLGERAGSLTNYQFAYPLSIKLPHTKLVLTLPTTLILFGDTALSDPISPKQVVVRTQQQIIDRQDPVMLEVIKQIQQQ